MRGFFFRLVITALGLWLAATIVHGVSSPAGARWWPPRWCWGS